MPDVVEQQLRNARDHLLDLGLQNKLLNYRPAKLASVDLAAEHPDALWSLFVKGTGAVEFEAGGESASHAAILRGAAAAVAPAAIGGPEPVAAAQGELPPLRSPSPASSTQVAVPTESANTPVAAADPPIASRPVRGGRGVRLRTPCAPEELEKRLLRLHLESRTALEERGVNVLFLAIGFLAWKPADRAEAVQAPVFLAPVTLDRTERMVFTLRNSGEDAVLNPCLLKKMQNDFRIALPPAPEDMIECDIELYLRLMAGVIKDMPGWSVQSRAALGLFSFNKYLMFQDLDPARWPDAANLLNKPLIRAVCGDTAATQEALSDLPLANDLDRLEPPEKVFQVLDADSSQQAVIAAVKRGASLVVQGPPGTGKSQTIANIIAEVIAQQKTVLFVSQKRAALEVVKGRLAKVGLGALCLELHSVKATRTAVCADLENSFASPPVPAAPDDGETGRMNQLRQRMGQYVAAVHEKLPASGLSPYVVFGRHMKMRDAPAVNALMPGCESWTRADVDGLRDLLVAYAQALEAVGVPIAHPWFGIGLTAVTGRVQADALEAVAGLTLAIAALQASVEKLGAIGGFPPPRTAGDDGAWLATCKLIVASPGVDVPLPPEGRWDAMPPEVAPLLALLRDYHATKDRLSEHYDFAKAGAVAWDQLAGRLRRHGGIGRFVRPRYWRDRSAWRKVLRGDYRPTIAQRITDMDNLAGHGNLLARLNASQAAAETLFKTAWKGPETSPESLEIEAKWLVALRGQAKAGFASDQLYALAATGNDRSALAAAAKDCDETLNAFGAAYQRLRIVIAAAESGVFPLAADKLALLDLAARLASMTARADQLPSMARYVDMRAKVDASALASFAAEAMRMDLETALYPLAFERQYLTLLAEDALRERDALRDFHGRDYERSANEFGRLDLAAMHKNRQRVLERAGAMRPDADFGAAKDSQLGVLKGELRRKRGGRSIRRLLRDASDVVPRIKPCFMMSPLSVAQYLDPEGVHFDVVIFDEASQVEPCDALGAIARGRQLVLVGDRKQLPPTQFFGGGTGGADEDDGDVDDQTAELADMESILDRGEAVLPGAALRWHYRSRHESLINFSNHEFYDGKLIVFQSSHRDPSQLGVSLEYHPEDLYDRGKSRTNRRQARRVAEAVIEHARKTPELSLGVATFSAAQQEAVLDELEILRHGNEGLESFFATGRPDPFFVKNLENIQGDERDVIFLSVGHGRSREGDSVRGSISNLNRQGGWRRLNVLITRARLRYVVYSSVLAEDLELAHTASLGALAFQKYLSYAKTGELPTVDANDGETESPFEEAVYEALMGKGIPTHRQVGCVGYRIDLAIVDEKHPGRYVLGIECDGATYHSAATARDRDRLRQQVLEGLGWRFCRIWSTDFFRDPRGELARLYDIVAKAQAGQWAPASFADSKLEAEPAGPAAAGTLSGAVNSNGKAGAGAPVGRHLPGMKDYVAFAIDKQSTVEAFYSQPIRAIGKTVAAIVNAEGPVREDDLATRLGQCYGIGRIGPRIRERIGAAIDAAVESQSCALRGVFLWPTDMREPPMRFRAEPFNADIANVCIEEIQRVACALVALQVAVGRDDLTAQTGRTLGFQMATAAVKARVGEAIEPLVADGTFSIDKDGRLQMGVAAPGSPAAKARPTPGAVL